MSFDKGLKKLYNTPEISSEKEANNSDVRQVIIDNLATIQETIADALLDKKVNPETFQKSKETLKKLSSVFEIPGIKLTAEETAELKQNIAKVSDQIEKAEEQYLPPEDITGYLLNPEEGTGPQVVFFNQMVLGANKKAHNTLSAPQIQMKEDDYFDNRKKVSTILKLLDHSQLENVSEKDKKDLRELIEKTLGLYDKLKEQHQIVLKKDETLFILQGGKFTPE